MKIMIIALLVSIRALAFDPTVTLEYAVKDYFKRTNILFVVDNSGSMTSNQEQVANLSKSFLKEFEDIYFKITAVSTDKADSVENLVIYKKMLNPEENLYKLITSFGVEGSMEEVVFSRIKQFYDSTYGKRFLRGNAPFEVIVLTDEAEQSGITAQELISSIQGRRFIFNGIVPQQETVSCSYDANDQNFIDAATLTGGMLLDICQGPSQMSLDYEKLAKEIAARAKPIAGKVPVRIIVIKEKIDVESIKVFYGSQEIKKGFVDTGWVFNESKNAIMIGEKIHLDINQPADTKLTVKYEILN